MKPDEKIMSQRIISLEVGQRTRFELKKMLSVRVMACNIGLVKGRRFATKVDRDNGAIYVTRIG